VNAPVTALREVVAALHAAGEPCQLYGAGETSYEGISIDSRTLARGALYVALRGERFDGHSFADAALERGAAALLLERPMSLGLPQIVVPDTRRALGIVAAAWRARFQLPLIGVAGSNGKTTTTQMIASILAQAFGEREGRRAWFATIGNRNNEIGVPLMLLELRAEHRGAVLELGMNHPGEIEVLAGWARPTVALVTNAQREHQEFLDSVEATARENGAAIRHLDVDGVAVFPADDPCAGIWRADAGLRATVDFALRGPAAVTAQAVVEAQSSRLTLQTPAGDFDTELAVGGEHNVRNALAATAACIAAAIAPSAIAQGLKAFRPVSGRGTRYRVAGGVAVIDDSYNANPDSVRAAIELLARHEGRHLLVLGDMAEVGVRGPQFHEEVGAHARARGIEQLFAFGPLSKSTVAAFGSGARHFETMEDLLRAIAPLVDTPAAPAPADPLTILIKGSRSMRMERVSAVLAPQSAHGASHSHA
jgi:UDP-N-acetylmuramoyl-tripeptide--D-alanyl-D-alanine ligase